MLVNVKNVRQVFVNLKATFQKAFDQTPSDWKKIAMVVPSSGKQNDYGWLGRFPKMRKWVGDKVVKALAAFNYSLVNDDFEATVEVERNDIEDDQLLGLATQAGEAGQSAAELPADLVFALLNQGFVLPCYDGQPFFDTDHPVGINVPHSVSNKGTKKLKVGSLAEAKASYGAARTAMRSFKDDEGASLKVRPTVLVVPPALEDDAIYLMTAEKFPDGTPNPYRNSAEVLCAPELTSDSAWFLLDNTRQVKPLIYQERKKPEFVEQTDYNAENVFMRKKFLFGAEARAAAGYGFWQMAYGSTGEAA